MSFVGDYGLDDFVRPRVILLLSLTDETGNKAMDILRLNKALRYFEYLTKQTKISFSNFHYGAVSDEVYENVEYLKECGLVDVASGNKMALTDDGNKAAKELLDKLNKKELQALNFAKIQINDLNHEELLGFMYFLLPNTAENSTVYTKILADKEKIVKSLYVKGKIPAKLAAQWLNVSEREIISRFGQHVSE